VRAVISRLVAEAKALREIGICTIAIMPNDTETYREDSFDNMKAFAAKHGFTFPYVIDETQEVARAYGAANSYFDVRRDRIVGFAAQQRLPAIYQFREYAVAGGLLSYGVDITDGYRQYGVYTGKILNGAKPADLPVLQPTKFEMVINLKTAKALGVKISDNLLSLADEVIE
jgi:ABC-type uncharacterized transport system substrate-binding protein